MQLLDEIRIDLRNQHNNILSLWITVNDNSLSRKWLQALNSVLHNQLLLEKNYCWLGWTNGDRSPQFICDQINASISAINSSGLDYHIECDPYTVENTVGTDLDVNHKRMNLLHRYFEDLQGWSGGVSQHYLAADPVTRWHIRQLNLLCHEYESLILSQRKLIQAPDWRRPSQLMCWLNAPRFQLEPEDLELFGIETMNRSLGGVYVGVNKAVGKHHWEVFCDEGGSSRINELTTTALRAQTQAAGDFDIEWGQNPGPYHWQIRKLNEFRQWLINNGFDPCDPSLTIGHPQVGQVDLVRSFGTQDHNQIWNSLGNHLDVYRIQTSHAQATYDYRWSDPDYIQTQCEVLK